MAAASRRYEQIASMQTASEEEPPKRGESVKVVRYGVQSATTQK